MPRARTKLEDIFSVATSVIYVLLYFGKFWRRWKNITFLFLPQFRALFNIHSSHFLRHQHFKAAVARWSGSLTSRRACQVETNDSNFNWIWLVIRTFCLSAHLMLFYDLHKQFYVIFMPLLILVRSHSAFNFKLSSIRATSRWSVSLKIAIWENIYYVLSKYCFILHIFVFILLEFAFVT